MTNQVKASIPLVTLGSIADGFDVHNRPIYRRSNNELYCMVSVLYHVRLTVKEDGSVLGNGTAEEIDRDEQVIRLV